MPYKELYDGGLNVPDARSGAGLSVGMGEVSGNWQDAARFNCACSQYFDDMRRKMLPYYNDVMCDGKWRGIVEPENFPPPRTAMHLVLA